MIRLIAAGIIGYVLVLLFVLSLCRAAAAADAAMYSWEQPRPESCPICTSENVHACDDGLRMCRSCLAIYPNLGGEL